MWTAQISWGNFYSPSHLGFVQVNVQFSNHFEVWIKHIEDLDIRINALHHHTGSQGCHLYNVVKVMIGQGALWSGPYNIALQTSWENDRSSHLCKISNIPVRFCLSKTSTYITYPESIPTTRDIWSLKKKSHISLRDSLCPHFELLAWLDFGKCRYQIFIYKSYLPMKDIRFTVT